MREKTMPDEKKLAAGRIIRHARLHSHLSQKEVATALHLSPSIVANWENGRSYPDLMILPALCDLLAIPMTAFFPGKTYATSLSNSEQRAAFLFRRLSEHDRQIAHAVVTALSSIQEDRLRRRVLTDFVPLRCDTAACRAGVTAPLMNPESGTEVYVRRSAMEEKADEIICVSDAAMSPAYFEGNQVYLTYCDRLREGEIGVFQVGGQTCIREYRGDHLRALAPGWPDISIREDEDMLFFGRVTGRVNASDLPTREEEEMLRHLAWSRRQEEP